MQAEKNTSSENHVSKNSEKENTRSSVNTHDEKLEGAAEADTLNPVPAPAFQETLQQGLVAQEDGSPSIPQTHEKMSAKRSIQGASQYENENFTVKNAPGLDGGATSWDDDEDGENGEKQN